MDAGDQWAAILGDPVRFDTLIVHLMSSSNEQRSQADLIFNLCKLHDPNTLAIKLAKKLDDRSFSSKVMCAILLRDMLNRDDWRFLSPSTKFFLKDILLFCLGREEFTSFVEETKIMERFQGEEAKTMLSVHRKETKTVMRNFCYTIIELASNILPKNDWPEFLQWMFRVFRPDSMPMLRESVFLIFGQLSKAIGETIVPHVRNNIHGVFLETLTSSDVIDVRIASLIALINFVLCLSSSEDRDGFKDLLPDMMRTLTEAVNCGQEATAQEALQLLIDIAGSEPRFLLSQWLVVVGSMLNIAEAEALEEATRHLTLKFVMTLTEGSIWAAGLMRISPPFIRRLFAILMKMLLDIEDDPAWHSAENEDEDEDEDADESNYSVGEEYLVRLSIALGGNTIVPHLEAYLVAPEWQKRHSALIALSCSKVMIEQVVTKVLNSFQDSHARVRWAAINAIGQLSTDLGPDLQVQYHRVLPALVAAMGDFQNPRVQAHAASTLLKVSESTPDILTPFLDGIVSKMLVLSQNGKQMVQDLARKLAGDPNLNFVEAVALYPPEVHIDMAEQQKHEADLLAAASQPLPDDDDDA